jgi:hypothetical protein
VGGSDVVESRVLRAVDDDHLDVGTGGYLREHPGDRGGIGENRDDDGDKGSHNEVVGYPGVSGGFSETRRSIICHAYPKAR